MTTAEAPPVLEPRASLDFPVVCIPGFLAPSTGLRRYWGALTCELDDQQGRAKCLCPAVSGVGSVHERACQVFYALVGGRVDYGEGHAARHGCERFGATIASQAAMHPGWSESRPVHLIGHSFGGQTARMLIQLLHERAFASHPDTSAAWVSSCVAVSAPLCGALATSTLGADPAVLAQWDIEQRGAASRGADPHPVARAESAAKPDAPAVVSGKSALRSANWSDASVPYVRWFSAGHLLGAAVHAAEWADVPALRQLGMDFQLTHLGLTRGTAGLVNGLADVVRGLIPGGKNSFSDKYSTWEDIQSALRSSGFEDSELVIAIDNTGSNDVKGWGGAGLHDIDVAAVAEGRPATPYDVVLSALGNRILSILDKDSRVPMYGFGDSVCSTHPSGCRELGVAKSIAEASAIYRDYVTDERIGRSGPTSFAGVIRQCMDRVRVSKRFHTLIILSDGAVDDEPEGGGPSPTVAAIREAADLPLAIVTVGIGIGPWDKMEKFDDRIRGRRCDNFQFVEAPRGPDLLDPASLRSFAVGAMQEIPQLWSWLREHSKFATPASMERAALPAPVAAKDYGGF